MPLWQCQLHLGDGLTHKSTLVHVHINGTHPLFPRVELESSSQFCSLREFMNGQRLRQQQKAEVLSVKKRFLRSLSAKGAQ